MTLAKATNHRPRLWTALTVLLLPCALATAQGANEKRAPLRGLVLDKEGHSWPHAHVVLVSQQIEGVPLPGDDLVRGRSDERGWFSAAVIAKRSYVAWAWESDGAMARVSHLADNVSIESRPVLREKGLTVKPHISIDDVRADAHQERLSVIVELLMPRVVVWRGRPAGARLLLPAMPGSFAWVSMESAGHPILTRRIALTQGACDRVVKERRAHYKSLAKDQRRVAHAEAQWDAHKKDEASDQPADELARSVKRWRLRLRRRAWQSRRWYELDAAGGRIEIGQHPQEQWVASPSRDRHSLRGRITGRDGMPVKGARMFLVREQTRRSLLTGDDGGFVFEGLDKSPEWLFMDASKSTDAAIRWAYVWNSKPLDVGVDNINLGTIRWQDFEFVELRVEDRAGAPIGRPGIAFVAAQTEGPFSGALNAHADHGGRFGMFLRKGAELCVAGMKENLYGATSTAAAGDVVRLVLDKAMVEIDGKVRDPAGNEIHDARVSFATTKDSDAAARLVARARRGLATRTNRQGAFKLMVPASCNYRVTIVKGHRETTRTLLLGERARSLNLVLK